MRAGRPQQGFTLVELAIVLVIIGLIIGGVLVGRDMIASATLKAQASQIQKYNAATNTFKDKYRAIPGDMVNATQFGLGTNGNGDGQMVPVESQFAQFVGESLNFWYHLNSSGLVDFPGTATQLPAGSYSQAQFQQNNPPGKISGTFLTASSFNPVYSGWGTAINGYELTGSALAFGQQSWDNGLSPAQSYAIDTALDDGKPYTGKVQRGTAARYIGFCTQNVCGYTGGGNCTDTTNYNVTLNTIECNLAFINQY